MPELLLELFSEEIPARMQRPAAEQLKNTLMDRFTGAGLLPEAVRTFVTPRRLVAVVDGLPGVQPDVKEEKKGPRTDAPQKAIDGFLKSAGLTLDQCETREDKKGTFYVAVIEKKGRPTTEVIAELVPDIVRGFSWPKSMRWGEGALRWVRPLHSILCTFDGEVVPFSVDGINSADHSRGHRFLCPPTFHAKHFEDYADKLEAAKVVLDLDQRKRIIWEDAKNLAFAERLELKEDDALLEENAGLVEWPVVLMGKIDEGFVRPVAEGGVPPEVLITSMKKNQKYFPLETGKDGALAPRFILTANIEAADGGAQIIAGNERVLRARLSDAKFFWDQDRKKKLEDRVSALKDIVFHAKLGSVHDKVERVAKLARHIATQIGANEELAERAAKLAKADLTTGMVGEFPDLQGLMGWYYALHDGEPADIAHAIKEHYAPLGPNDQCPSAKVSVAVALADKLDTLVGFWINDETPTGSKDPYALRRAALGVIRILLENEVRLDLVSMFEKAEVGIEPEREFIKLYGSVAWSGREVNPKLIGLLDFFADRLKVYMRDRGLKYDIIDAVFALEGQDDLVLSVARMTALKNFLDSEDGTNLLAAYKRASNILKIEEKKDKTSYAGSPDPSLFDTGEEKDLSKVIEKAVAEAAKKAEAEKFEDAMAAMAKLRKPVDNFFDKVTVNADTADLRKNRLFLLSQIRTALETVADFSKLEG